MADGEKRIIELEELTTLTDNDYIAVDNSASGGKTKKFKPKNLQDATNQVLKDVAYMEWENTDYYIRGDIVAYDGYIYVCKVDEATYGSFVSSDWKKTYVERWGRDLFFDISSQEMIFSDSEYTLPYSKGDVVYRYYPHPSNDGFQMRFYVAKADYPNGVTEYVASQWDEYLSLSEVVDALNKETNKSVDEALVEGTASGSIASFTDGSTLPMKKLEVAIEPVQSGSGEPSPTNVRPISGWDECKVSRTGKNLLNVNKIQKVKYNSAENERLGVSFEKQGTYTVSANVKQSGVYIYAKKITNGVYGDVSYIATPDNLNSTTYTLTENDKLIVYTAIDNINLIETAKQFMHDTETQIELNDEATTYEPYNGQIYTIDLDGTHYGGKLDVVSGTLVVDRVMVTYDGSSDESWQYQNGTFTIGVADIKRSSSNIDIITNCNSYKPYGTRYRDDAIEGSIIKTIGDNGQIAVKDSAYGSSVTDWKTYLQSNNVEVVYELATPQTIQLTPTEVKSLLATNNVFADTGDILDATYVRNANITINELIRRIENLENA